MDIEDRCMEKKKIRTKKFKSSGKSNEKWIEMYEKKQERFESHRKKKHISKLRLNR
jgi:hypothetical protein